MPDHPPKLIVFAGLPGSGKSTLARALADRIGALWLPVDTLEASFLRAGYSRSFESGLAAYLAARGVASDHLRLGRSVVIDAVNGVEPARKMWRALAEETRAERYVIEVVCADREEHRRRVEQRTPASPPLPAPSWEDVRAREYLAWDEPVLSVDSSRPTEESLQRIFEHLAGPPGPRVPTDTAGKITPSGRPTPGRRKAPRRPR